VLASIPCLWCSRDSLTYEERPLLPMDDDVEEPDKSPDSLAADMSDREA
jgi:hypothetical protein